MLNHPQEIVLRPERHEIYFRQKACDALPVCQALCCRKWDIHLASHEYSSGRYKAEAFCSLDKKPCIHPRTPCSYTAYRLKKKKDGSCIYLDRNNRCTIYACRPLVCRNFICDNGFSIEPVCSFHQELPEDAQVCSFEGGLEFKAKFLFSPYLRLKTVTSERNAQQLIFKDRTSCKDTVVRLRGLVVFAGAADAEYFLKQFNGRNTVGAVFKKMTKKMKRQDFVNTVLYLIDEKILVGVF